MNKETFRESHGSFIEHNIYADKSALILEWLLFTGINKNDFSIREVAREKKVSIGLVQKTFNTLVHKGYLKVTGVRTAKKFTLNNSKALLKSWLEYYNILKKCKMWNYRSAFSNREKILHVLQESNLSAALALHSAASALGYRNTNLQTVELYLTEPKLKSQIEQTLLLEPQERGYEVLLITPYYKSLLEESKNNHPFSSSPLLTVLDLYHFPLRGQEQAEFMLQRLNELKNIK